jgi:pimeloyl-ACP methyl ester carboxylesterase
VGETWVQRSEVSLFVRDEGHGEPILLIHGWPDTSAVWDLVCAQLISKGRRCIIPDQRGCGQSSKPADTSSYAALELVSDLVAVMDHLGIERCHVVGHDWGANLGWALASFFPQRVASLVVMGVGHPTSFRSAGLEQQMRSWYTLLFFHEGVGEAFLRRNNYEAMREWLRHPRTDLIIAELERDGQMEAQLRWYRANIPPSAFVSDPPTMPPIEPDVLGIWSSDDLALSESQMTNSAQYCRGTFTYRRIDNYGHWLPIEAAALMAEEIDAFVRSHQM